jgi:hypothetical protein
MTAKRYRKFETWARHCGVMSKNHLLGFNEFRQDEMRGMFDEDGGIFACHSTAKIIAEFCKTYKGYHIATLTIEDGEDACYYVYDNAIHFVNRERYYICRGLKHPAFYQDKVPYGRD